MSTGIYYKDVPVTKKEDLSGKYQSMSHVDGKNYARIWYNGDVIDPKKTYTERYLKKLEQEQETKNAKSEKKAKKKEKEDKEDSNFLWKVLMFPFKLIWKIIKFLLKTFGLSFIVALFSKEEEE